MYQGNCERWKCSRNICPPNSVLCLCWLTDWLSIKRADLPVILPLLVRFPGMHEVNDIIRSLITIRETHRDSMRDTKVIPKMKSNSAITSTSRVSLTYPDLI